MKILYAPWRGDYTTNDARDPKRDSKSADECVFCTQLNENKDEDNFILARYQHCYAVLNRYPYNGGHLLILPLQHHAKLEQLSEEARNEIMHVLNQSAQILEKQLEAKGVNIGLNMGKAAGAGIPAHLHFHVLPRWMGDTNFLPLLAQTKTISTDLSAIYKALRPSFEAI